MLRPGWGSGSLAKILRPKPRPESGRGLPQAAPRQRRLARPDFSKELSNSFPALSQAATGGGLPGRGLPSSQEGPRSGRGLRGSQGPARQGPRQPGGPFQAGPPTGPRQGPPLRQGPPRQAGASQAGASQARPPGTSQARQGPPGASPQGGLPGRGLPGRGLPGRQGPPGKRLRCFTRRFGVSYSRAT